MKRLLPLLFVLPLMGQDCEPQVPPPPKEVNAFCHGTPLKEPPPPTYFEKVETIYDNNTIFGTLGVVLSGDVDEQYDAIVGGIVAVDRLSTVYVRMEGVGSCSGAILDAHTVVTAGHCAVSTEGYKVCLHPDYGPCWTTDKATRHPSYYRWSNTREPPHDDIAVLHFPDVVLPEPYIELGYIPIAQASSCEEVRAVGWGAWKRENQGAIPPPGFEYHVCPDLNEDGMPDSRCLLQAEQRVVPDNWAGRPAHSSEIYIEQVPWGGKCFGDSGSVTYVKAKDPNFPDQPAKWYAAGVTSTVTSLDCIRGGTDTSLQYYKTWVLRAAAGAL